MIVVFVVVLECFKEIVIEYILKNVFVLTFAIGYGMGIASLLLYLRYYDNENLVKALNILKITAEPAPTEVVATTAIASTTVATAIVTENRPRRNSNPNQAIATAKTKARNEMNTEIVNYFDTFLDMISRTRTIKQLKDDIQMARDKKIEIKTNIERRRNVSLD